MPYNFVISLTSNFRLPKFKEEVKQMLTAGTLCCRNAFNSIHGWRWREHVNHILRVPQQPDATSQSWNLRKELDQRTRGGRLLNTKHVKMACLPDQAPMIQSQCIRCRKKRQESASNILGKSTVQDRPFIQK